MPTLVPYNPDGTRQVSGPGSREPGGYVRADEERALLSATKAWWTRKGIPRLPPEGATVTVDGEQAYRYERVPIIVDDEVVDTRLEWVDLRIRARAEAEAAALDEAKKAHAAAKRTATKKKATDE